MRDGTVDAAGVRRYGAWAGFPQGRAEDTTLCLREVRVTKWLYGQCSRKRGHGTDGLYCKQHGKTAT